MVREAWIRAAAASPSGNPFLAAQQRPPAIDAFPQALHASPRALCCHPPSSSSATPPASRSNLAVTRWLSLAPAARVHSIATPWLARPAFRARDWLPRSGIKGKYTKQLPPSPPPLLESCPHPEPSPGGQRGKEGAGGWGLGRTRSREQTLIPNLESPISNPQSPIPNPQSPIPNPQSLIFGAGIIPCACLRVLIVYRGTIAL